MCWAIYSGRETRVFPTGALNISGEIRLRSGRAKARWCALRAQFISSVIRVMRREIEAQLVGSMLLLDTAADAIVRRAVNHHQHDEERS
jgi:hypothetical protein